MSQNGSSESDAPSEEYNARTYHSCWKKKSISRVLLKRGWRKEPTAKAAEACPGGGICYVQKVNGCPCKANWKLLPKAYVDCIGGKVSLAKVLVRDNITDIAPRTYYNFDTFSEACDRGVVAATGSKWYVKVSHMNARRGVTCYNTAEEARLYCKSLEVNKPTWFRYVIQEEVPRLVLHNERKMLLRLWTFVTVHGGTGDIWLHVCRRLRANAMRNGYDPKSTERDADVEHCTDNVFESTADDWEPFQRVWAQCASAAHKVVKSMVDLWHRRNLPPMEKEGSGRFNHLAFDFIPSYEADGTIKPYLLEVNVDPSFCNKCTETQYVLVFFDGPFIVHSFVHIPLHPTFTPHRGFADDVVSFFAEAVGAGEPLVVPDTQFATIQVR